MFLKRSSGFTLIELLVVIAIIGILASVVLASLNSARDKGTIAALKANLNGVSSQAALFYEGVGLYNDGAGVSICENDEADTPVGAAHLVTAAEALDPVGVVGCNSDAVSWAVAAQLVGDSVGDYFCKDSTGYAGELTGTVGVGGDFDTDPLNPTLVCPVP